MSQLTIQLSDRSDALIAQLQKEIFNRRRKKVSAAGVVETLVESGAKSQSDKRFATSWKNLIADIEKAAKLADAHGTKPASLSDEEWAMVLNHRTRTPRPRPATTKPKVAKPAAAKAKAVRNTVAKAATSTRVATKRTSPSVAKRMAKAVSRLASTSTTPPLSSNNGAVSKEAVTA